MVLFHLEYEIVSTGQPFICKIVGDSENDVVNDLVSQVGQIRVVDLYRKSEIQRVTGTVRRKIIERSLSTEPTRGKGRPRKYDL
jgi:hypothetical protein